MQPGELTDRLFGTRAYTEGARFQGESDDSHSRIIFTEMMSQYPLLI